MMNAYYSSGWTTDLQESLSTADISYINLFKWITQQFSLRNFLSQSTSKLTLRYSLLLLYIYYQKFDRSIKHPVEIGLPLNEVKQSLYMSSHKNLF